MPAAFAEDEEASSVSEGRDDSSSEAGAGVSESPAISESAGVSCWTGCEEISTAAAFATSWGTAFAGTTGLEVEVAGFTCWLAALGAAGVAGFVGAAGVTLGAGAAFDAAGRAFVAAGAAAVLAGVAFLV